MQFSKDQRLRSHKRSRFFLYLNNLMFVGFLEETSPKVGHRCVNEIFIIKILKHRNLSEMSNFIST